MRTWGTDEYVEAHVMGGKSRSPIQLTLAWVLMLPAVYFVFKALRSLFRALTYNPWSANRNFAYDYSAGDEFGSAIVSLLLAGVFFGAAYALFTHSGQDSKAKPYTPTPAHSYYTRPSVHTPYFPPTPPTPSVTPPDAMAFEVARQVKEQLAQIQSQGLGLDTFDHHRSEVYRNLSSHEQQLMEMRVDMAITTQTVDELVVSLNRLLEESQRS